MSLITNLSSTELTALCQIITPKEIKEYFKKNPRTFNKIKPGFRPESLSDSDVFSIVESNRQEPFIETYFDNNVPHLIEAVEGSFPDFGEGDDFDYSALAKEIKKTPFSIHPRLFFALTNQKYPKDIEEKVISQMEKKTNTSSQKKTIKPVKASSATVNKKIEELQEQVASLQSENENYQNKLTNLQERYDQLNERFSYEESGIDFGEAFDEFEHLSVGMISSPNYEGKRWVYRLADINSSTNIVSFEKDNSQPYTFSNRDRLYFKEEELPDGFLGIWGWTATPNINNPSTDYVVSAYYPEYSPIEFLIVDDCSSTDDIISELSKGLELSPSARRFALAYFNNKTDKYIGVLCHTSDIEHSHGIIRLKSDVISLPIYSFERKSIIQLNDSTRIYNKLQLGPAENVIKTISDSEIVKKLILNSIPWSVFKERGVAKAEWQNFKKYLDELKTENLIESIKFSLGCTSEEATQQLNSFIEKASEYIDASSFDDNVLKAVVEGDDTLMAKCTEIVREKCLADNNDEVEKANQKLQELQDKIASANDELAGIKEECKKEQEAAAPLKELIENGDSLAEKVQEKVTNRINAARKDASDFLAEMAFYYPNAVSEHPRDDQKDELPYFTTGIEMEEPDELKDWEDATDTLKHELVEAGVDPSKAGGLSEYLYSAYINRIPLLLIGPNGSNIIDALSASLYGQTAGTLTLPDSYNRKIVDECTKSDSRIIKIVNPLNSSWLPHLPDILQSEGIYFCAVYPFPEDIQFEPNSLCNLFLPLYTELFVKTSPTNSFIGGVFASDYEDFDAPLFEEVPHRKELGLLHASLFTKERMQTILSYMKEMSSGDYEDDALSTVVLPYALTTQQNELLKEILDGSWQISSNLKNELSQIWGDFE